MDYFQRPAPLFPKLPPGRSADPEKVVAHRRGRLLGAMIEAVSRRGYEAVRTDEVVALAGISKRDFYEIFASKEECFLATFEEVIDRALEVVAQAFAGGGKTASDLRARMIAGGDAYAALLAAQPAAASLAVIDSLSLGIAAVGLRERAEARFELILRQGVALHPEGGELSEVVGRGLIGGARRVVYRFLRDGAPERVAEHTGELVDWALGYRRPAGARVLDDSFFAKLARAERRRGTAQSSGEEGPPGWEEQPGSERSMATLPPRERILRAVARLAAAGGYGSVTMPAIAASARVSNATFYREFSNKREALLAAFDALSEQALTRGLGAFAEHGEWPYNVAAALHAVLTYIADNPTFGRLAFVELAAAGREALDHADAATQRFVVFHKPPILPAELKPLPEIVVEAIAGGIWTVIGQEINRGRVASLPEIAPELADFMLAPFEPR